MTRQKSSGSTGFCYVNGAQDGAAVNAGNENLTGFSNFRLAKSQAAGSAQLNADYGEVIIYNKVVSAAERQRIETYLGLKYGISIWHHYKQLTGTAGANVFPYVAPFTNRIFGIARCDSSLLDQKVSASTDDPGLVLMNGARTPVALAFPNNINDGTYPVALTNNQYQILGDDNGAVTFTRNFGGGSANMLGRTWKVTDVGNVGTVTLWFKNSTFTQLANAGTYYLAYGKDPGMGTGETFVPMTNLGGASNDFYVQVNFPNADTTYFTITKDTSTVGPAAVVRGLELWLRSEKGLTAPSAITNWSDYSFNSHHMVNSTPAKAALETGGPLLNYHHYIKSGDLIATWNNTTGFRARTIVAVAKAKTTVAGEDLMGFDVNGGLRFDGAAAVRKTGTGADWTNGGSGVLRGNGTVAGTSVSLVDWAIVSGDASASSPTRNRFFLGEFSGASAADSIKFAEVIVYDSDLSGNPILRLESYLAIKYGITLGHDYTSSANTSVYTRGSYANQILGIGRDDAGQLLQRQSTSTSLNSVVKMALQDLKANDSLNTGTFGGNMHYLVAGHNGVSTNCWTTNDISVTGEEGQHVRIGRTWKLQITGAWSSGSDVKFILDTTVTSVIPTLPSGSTSYLMYVALTPNFTVDPSTEVFTMTRSLGRWEASIPASFFGSSGATDLYFTFGSKLNSSYYTDNACNGGQITLFRSNASDFCGRLTLTSVAPPATFVAYTDSSGTTDVPAAGTCIDTLKFNLPTTLTPALYTVKFDTASATTGCFGLGTYGSTPAPGNAPQALGTVLISDNDSLRLVYPGDTLYCADDTNATPDRAGSFGGVFSLISGPGGYNINMVMDTTSGSILMSSLLVPSGNRQHYQVRFTTHGTSGCPNSKDYNFTVKRVKNITFAYDSTSFCNGNNTAYLPNFGADSILGSTFSSVPALPSGALNTATGALTPQNVLTPGNYIITCTPPTDSCGNVATTVVTIRSAAQTVFNYLQTNYCVGGGTIGPFVSSTTAGTYQLATSSPTTGLALTGTNGFIDLNTSPTGTYHIEFVPSATGCKRSTFDTITISVPPNPAFTVTGGDTLCISSGPVELVPTVPGGTFSSLDGNLLIVGGDSLAPNNVSGGPFSVEYVTNDPNCPSDTTVLVWVKGAIQANIEFPSQALCQNELGMYPQFFSGTAGGKFITTPGLNLDILNGYIDPGTSNDGSYIIEYVVPDLLCPDTIAVDTIVIDTVGPATFNLVADSVCYNSGNYGITAPPSNSVFAVMNGNTPFAGAIVGGDSVSSSVLLPGGPYAIRNIRTTGACSDTAYDYIVINPQDIADIEFIPNTVCIGGNDPYPVIQGLGGGYFLTYIPGDTVDSLTGLVQIGTQPQYYIVEYFTTGRCPSSDTAGVQVSVDIDPTFSYASSDYCQSDTANYVAIFATPSSLGEGTFSSSPIMLSLDDSTGAFSPSQNQAGSYNIKYTIGQTGACFGEYTYTINITAPNDTCSISLADSTWCWGDTSRPQVIIDGPSGGLFSADPGLVFLDGDLGIISLPGSIPDSLPYTIYYQLETVCQQDQFTTQVYIDFRDDASFAYPQSAYCNGGPNPLPINIATPGGSFLMSRGTGNVIGVNTVTGELDLSTNDSSGLAYVQYTTNGICPSSYEVSVDIGLQPPSPTLRADPPGQVCQGYDMQLTASGASYYTFIQHSSNDTFPSASGEQLFANLQANDSITIIFDYQGCIATQGHQVNVVPTPQQQVLSYMDTVVAETPWELMIAALTNATSFRWFIDQQVGSVDFASTTGNTFGTPVDSGVAVPISVIPLVTDPLSPASFRFFIEPYSQGCRGTADTVYIRVNPKDIAVFIPQVMTPNDNGANDTWLIQWAEGVDPAKYTIKLFNESGGLVYTMTPLVSTWVDRSLADGVYWYILYNEKGEAEEAGGLTIRSK